MTLYKTKICNWKSQISKKRLGPNTPVQWELVHRVAGACIFILSPFCSVSFLCPLVGHRIFFFFSCWVFLPVSWKCFQIRKCNRDLFLRPFYGSALQQSCGNLKQKRQNGKLMSSVRRHLVHARKKLIKGGFLKYSWTPAATMPVNHQQHCETTSQSRPMTHDSD